MKGYICEAIMSFSKFATVTNVVMLEAAINFGLKASHRISCVDNRMIALALKRNPHKRNWAFIHNVAVFQ